MVVILRAVITLLCGVGLYVSLFMLAKTRRAERGELLEPSVVTTPQARLYAGLPNSLLGTAFYPALAAACWWTDLAPVAVAVACAMGFAAITSVALAYSLLFITKRPCPYCWTGHTINWSLALLIAFLIKISY